MMSRWAKWGLVFGVWTVLALTASIQSYIWRLQRDMKPVWSEILAVQFADYLFWALVTPPILFLAWRFPFKPRVWQKNVVVHLGIVTALLALHSLYKVPLYWWAYEKYRDVPFQKMYVEQLVAFYDSLWMYWTIVLAAYVLAYYREMKERDLRASLMQNQLSKAQLQALKTQLQPHFLFNTLHAVTSLVHEDPARAETLLVQLSDLLRMSLDNPLQEVPLRQELEFLNLYLEIQRARFGERLVLEEKIDPATLDAMVPSMLLQPLVENSVRHAIEPRSNGGHLEIAVSAAGTVLRITVRDDGPGISRPGNGRRREGIGIANTRARLQHLYGEEHLFLLQNRSSGGCEVLVQIPLRIVQEPEDEFMEESYDLSNADRG